MAKETTKRSGALAKRSENVVAMQRNPATTELALPANLKVTFSRLHHLRFANIAHCLKIMTNLATLAKVI